MITQFTMEGKKEGTEVTDLIAACSIIINLRGRALANFICGLNSNLIVLHPWWVIWIGASKSVSIRKHRAKNKSLSMRGL